MGTPPESRRALRAESSLLDPKDVERLLRSLLVVIFGLGLATCGVGLAFGDRRDTLIGGVATGFGAVLLLLFRTGRVKWAAVGAALGTLAMAVGLISTGQGIHDLGIVVFPLVIIASHVLFGRRLATTFTALAVTLSTGVALAEALGVLRTELSHATRFEEVVLVALLMSATGYVVRLLVDSLYEGLARAHMHEQSYREVFNATSEGIYVHDAKTGIILDVNDGAAALSGFTREELIGRPLQTFDAPGDFSPDLAVSRIEGAAGAGTQTFEWFGRRKDGSEAWVEVSLRATSIQGEPRVLAVVRDIDERRRMQERLRESEKLEAVGRLAGGIAHDFNNQLTGILANASLIRDSITDSPKLARSLDAIIRCSERSAELTRQLLAFARRGKHQSVPVDLGALVKDVAELLERSIDKAVEIELRLEGTPCTTGDPSVLSSALLNLGLNARDAMLQGGKLTFAASVVELGGQAVLGPGGPLEAGTYARVVVSDTGTGMDESTKSRVFEPFFTTKPNGNGMGLAMVYGTVESHRGAILVKSSQGRGTSFEIFLPQGEPADLGEAPARMSPRPSFAGTRVLLAEDESEVAAVTTAMLEALGCRVTLCHDGQEIVEHFRREGAAYDVVIVDQIMPRVSGREALSEIRALRPQTKVLVVSGFAGHDGVVTSEDGQAFLPKPFDIDLLAAALSRLVD
jgi:PAS domain S-box-containing protein